MRHSGRLFPLAKLQYSEGTWFSVPLLTGQYAVGLIARKGSRGRLFGYFFGPPRKAVPSRAQLGKLNPEDSVFLSRFGDLNLLEGSWPIIYHEKDWDRSRWPLPPFSRFDEIEGKAWLTTYSEELKFIREEQCEPGRARSYPKDCLSGAGALETHLTRVFSSKSHTDSE